MTTFETFFELTVLTERDELVKTDEPSPPFCFVLLDFFRVFPLAEPVSSTGRARFASFSFDWIGVLSVTSGDSREK
jgi:hypothetical protein